jgi:hypothetical protein
MIIDSILLELIQKVETITKRKVVISDTIRNDFPIITQTEILINIELNQWNLLVLIHEAAHCLEANEEQSKLPNLGLDSKRFCPIENYKREIRAREISKEIFYDWCKNNLDGVPLEYANYLMFDLFKDIEQNINYPEKLDIKYIKKSLSNKWIYSVKIDDINYELPKANNDRSAKILARLKLNEFGLDIKTNFIKFETTN